jgi:tetratricopeptide (TPR) repeat protein
VLISIQPTPHDEKKDIMKVANSLIALGIALALTGAIACGKDPSVAKKEHLDNGNRLYERKQYAEAAIEFRNAVQVDEKFAEARVRLAQTYEQLGDSPNALREYLRAADLLPQDAEIQVKASEYLLAADLLEDAATRAENAIRAKPSHVRARLLLALALSGLKGLDSAVAQVEEAIRMDPSEPSALAQLGRFRLAQRNLVQAEKAFMAAYGAAPRSVDALLGLANFYMATGRLGESEEWLKKAMEVAPQDRRASRMLAALYLQTNRFPEAEAPLKAYTEAEPSPAARLVLADYYFASRRRDEARQILDAIKDREETFAEARRRLSILEFLAGRVSEAHKLLDEALAKDSGNALALLMKGRLFLFQARHDDAIRMLKQAVQSDAELAEAQYWLGVAYRDVGDNESARTSFSKVQNLDTNEVGSKLQLSQLNLLEGKADAALDFANQAVAIQPGNLQARVVRVDALVAKGDLSAALLEANAVAEKIPNSPQPQMQLGRIYARQGDYRAAERAYLRAAEISKGADDAVGALVDTRIQLGKSKEARAAVDDALAKRPKSAWLHVYASRIYKAERDLGQAERALKDALAIDPGNLQAYLELARMYVEGGRLDDFRAQLEAIVARQPKEVWAHTMIAISLELQNRKTEARDRYRKALEIDPRAAIAANNLAMIYVEEGQNLDQALQLAQTAVQQRPDSPEVSDTLGSVYLKQNLPALAIRPFELSASKDPDNPLYHYHLGLAFAQMGDRAKARVALGRALSLGRNFDGMADAKRVLSSL